MVASCKLLDGNADRADMKERFGRFVSTCLHHAFQVLFIGAEGLWTL